MDRCKLEYMIKRLDFKDKKELIRKIDYKGDYEFSKDISNFLLNPDTDDPEILTYLGPYCNIYYCSLRYYKKEIKEDKENMEKELEEIKEKFRNIFKAINDLCVKNNTYPLFENPDDLKKCEERRLDLIEIVPEEFLNKFFGVDSLRDYEPPLYSKE